jgi:hypothetical protein
LVSIVLGLVSYWRTKEASDKADRGREDLLREQLAIGEGVHLLSSDVRTLAGSCREPAARNALIAVSYRLEDAAKALAGTDGRPPRGAGSASGQVGRISPIGAVADDGGDAPASAVDPPPDVDGEDRTTDVGSPEDQQVEKLRSGEATLLADGLTWVVTAEPMKSGHRVQRTDPLTGRRRRWNDVPRITGLPQYKSLRIGDVVHAKLVVIDGDGDDVRISSRLPPGAEFDRDDGRFVWKPKQLGRAVAVWLLDDGKDTHTQFTLFDVLAADGEHSIRLSRWQS